MEKIKAILLYLFCSLLIQHVAAQDNITKQVAPILREALTLALLEKAAIAIQTLYPGMAHQDGEEHWQWLAYVAGNRVCIIQYYTETTVKPVFATLSISEGMENSSFLADTTRRNFSSFEDDLYILADKTFDRMAEDAALELYPGKATLVRFPIITPNGRKCYIMTRAVGYDKLIFGNDYVAEFNQANEMLSHKKLHPATIFTDFVNLEKETVNPNFNVHQHDVGHDELWSVTDIATALVYHPLGNWDTFLFKHGKTVDVLTYFTMQVVRWDKDLYYKEHTQKPDAGEGSL